VSEETNTYYNIAFEGQPLLFSYELILEFCASAKGDNLILADLDNLPDPDVLAADIIENLEAGLESFREIMIKLNSK
jgi:hypothetical protein